MHFRVLLVIFSVALFSPAYAISQQKNTDESLIINCKYLNSQGEFATVNLPYNWETIYTETIKKSLTERVLYKDQDYEYSLMVGVWGMNGLFYNVVAQPLKRELGRKEFTGINLFSLREYTPGGVLFRSLVCTITLD